MSYIYLASPYSHERLEVMEDRYIDTLLSTAIFHQMGFYVFSPIVYCHIMATQYGLPTDNEHWADFNRTMILPASRMFVLMLDGWMESEGVAHEVSSARGLNMNLVGWNLTSNRKELFQTDWPF